MDCTKCMNELKKLISAKKREKPEAVDIIANAVVIAGAIALLPHTLRINKGKGFSIQALTWKIDVERTPLVDGCPEQGYRHTITLEPFPALLPVKRGADECRL